MKTIAGKTVWITGASSGIGEALAYELAGKGCKLILSSRNVKELERVKGNCTSNTNVRLLVMDLLNFEQAPNFAKQAWDAFNGVDLLINNAGISQRSLIMDTHFEVYKKLMDVNYLGTVALSKAILPYFIQQQHGHFVTVTSLMGRFGSPYRSGYCGAKHALHGFFDVLRMEHEKEGIAVTLVCPGFVQTNVAKNALTGDGSPQRNNDGKTQTGLAADHFARKMVKAVERKKFEVHIGQKEVMGIWLKRFFPRLLHRVVLKSEVT